MSWNFKWYRSWQEIWGGEFQRVWNDALPRSAEFSVFHDPKVIRPWSETCAAAQGIEPLFGHANHSGGAEMILLWAIYCNQGRYWMRRELGPAGGAFFGYHDPLIARDSPDMDWPQFWSAARCDLKRSCDHALFRLVHEKYASGVFSEPCPELSPVLDLNKTLDLDALLARCSSNHRGDIRRRIRRLDEKGKTELWVAGSHETEAVLADFQTRFLPSHKRVCSEKNYGNMFDRKGVLEWVCRILKEGLADGWCHYSALKVDGKTVAWHVGLFQRDALYWWIPAYDPDVQSYSPGKVLLAKLIEHGIQKQWKRLHFQTGGQDYKMDWKPAAPGLRTIRWHSPCLRGRLMSIYDALNAYRGRQA